MHKRLGLAALLCSFSLVMACGDDAPVDYDATPIPPTPDAAPAPDGPRPGVCDPNPDNYDLIETMDGTNDLYLEGGAPEDTGQAIDSGNSFTIGGCINANNPDDTHTDADFYVFSTTTSALRLEIVARNPESIEGLAIAVFDNTGAYLGAARYNNPVGMAVLDLPELFGDYLVSVEADAVATDREEYAIYVRAIDPVETCPIPGAADYTEADESALSHRANDMVSVTYPFTPVLTANPDDVPESLGGNPVVTVNPGAAYQLVGNSAQVASDGDEYFDRDTFLIASGTETTEMIIRLNWPPGDNADMDYHLFAADDVDSLYAYGANIGFNADEIHLVQVAPDIQYWLWTGSYIDANTLPQDYAISVCGGTYVSPFVPFE